MEKRNLLIVAAATLLVLGVAVVYILNYAQYGSDSNHNAEESLVKDGPDFLLVRDGIATTKHASFVLAEGWEGVEVPQESALVMGAETEIRNEALGCSIVYGDISFDSFSYDGEEAPHYYEGGPLFLDKLVTRWFSVEAESAGKGVGEYMKRSNIGFEQFPSDHFSSKGLVLTNFGYREPVPFQCVQDFWVMMDSVEVNEQDEVVARAIISDKEYENISGELVAIEGHDMRNLLLADSFDSPENQSLVTSFFSGIIYRENNSSDKWKKFVLDSTRPIGHNLYIVEDTIYTANREGLLIKVRFGEKDFEVIPLTNISTDTNDYGSSLHDFLVTGDHIYYLTGTGCRYMSECSPNLYKYNKKTHETVLLAEGLYGSEVLGISDGRVYVRYGSGDAGYFSYSVQSVSVDGGGAIRDEAVARGCDFDHEECLRLREESQDYYDLLDRLSYVDYRGAIVPLKDGKLDRKRVLSPEWREYLSSESDSDKWMSGWTNGSFQVRSVSE